MNKLILLILLSLLISCAKEQDEQEAASTEDIEDIVEIGLTSVVGALDEQEGESVSSSSLHLNGQSRNTKAVCSGRAVNESCISSSRTVAYDECTILGTAQTLDGEVSLSYSDSSCGFSSTGDTVTRTVDRTRTTSWGAEITVSTEDSEDYTNNTYGGGSRLTKTASGVTLDILGKHKTRTSAAGRSVFDVSMRTTDSIVSNKLGRDGRVISSGTFQLNHNNALYTSTFSFNDLSYSSNCCYPTGGSVAISFSGALTGNATVSFSTCGTGTIDYNDEEIEIEFYSCE